MCRREREREREALKPSACSKKHLKYRIQLYFTWPQLALQKNGGGGGERRVWHSFAYTTRHGVGWIQLGQVWWHGVQFQGIADRQKRLLLLSRPKENALQYMYVCVCACVFQEAQTLRNCLISSTFTLREQVYSRAASGIHWCVYV